MREETHSEEPRLLVDKLILAGDTKIRVTQRPSALTWAAGLTPFASLRTKVAEVASPTVLTQLSNPLILKASMAEGVQGRNRQATCATLIRLQQIAWWDVGGRPKRADLTVLDPPNRAGPLMTWTREPNGAASSAEAS